MNNQNETQTTETPKTSKFNPDAPFAWMFKGVR